MTAISTLFQPNAGGGGAASGSSDYIKDQFQDTSRVATNNSGLTSTALTNPLGFFFNDTDSTQYGIKTLYIDSISLIADRSQWQNGQPTYTINWTENYPSVRGYCYGSARLRNNGQGHSLELRAIGDVLGVTGQIRQLAWIVNPNQQTGTAVRSTDAVAGSNITFGTSAVSLGVPGLASYNAFLHSASVASNDLHDYRIAANQAGSILEVVGVIVYFQNTGSNIEQKPGTTYIDKARVTTGTGASLALPVVVGLNGAKSVVAKSSAGIYSVNTVETPCPQTIGIGTNLTNLVNVTTGTGASYPLGAHVVAVTGTSYYYGRVTNQSTDTLTVNPTLAFGLSGLLYKFMQDGSTIAISASLYNLSSTIDFGQAQNLTNPQAIGVTFGTLNFQDPLFKYRAWGRDLALAPVDGYPGLGFVGNTQAFLQVDGKYSAAEFEYVGAGILHGTFAINGLTSWGINAGSTGSFKKTIFSESGPGWNSFVFTPGQSYTNIAITKINLYDRKNPIGVTAGVLSSFNTAATSVDRGAAQNATIIQLGRMQRIYSDSLYLTGDWARGVSSAFVGGVAFHGASTNSAIAFQYYGTNFALIGTVGGSMACLLDGASISTAFNAVKTASLGWHTVSCTYQAGGTAIIQGVDYTPADNMELVCEQKYTYDPRTAMIPTVYKQAITPFNPKEGDFWVEQLDTYNVGTPSVWMRLFNMWNKIQFIASTDDPQISAFFRFGGTSTGGTAGAVGDGETFNSFAWATIATAPISRQSMGAANSQFAGGVHLQGGFDAAGANKSEAYRFNKLAWAAITNITSPTIGSAPQEAFAGVIVSKGTPDNNVANAVNTAYKWNGAAWGTLSAYAATNSVAVSSLFIGGLVSAIAGTSTGGGSTVSHDTRNSADTTSTATTIPVGSNSAQGSNVAGSLGLISNVAFNAASTVAYSWNGSAWSAALTNVYTTYPSEGCGQGYLSSRAMSVRNAGNAATGASPGLTTELYNGTAFSTGAASTTARGRGACGVA